MLLAILSLVAAITIIALMFRENPQAPFNEFCAIECINGKRYKNNYFNGKQY